MGNTPTSKKNTSDIATTFGMSLSNLINSSKGLMCITPNQAELVASFNGFGLKVNESFQQAISLYELPSFNKLYESFSSVKYAFDNCLISQELHVAVQNMNSQLEQYAKRISRIIYDNFPTIPLHEIKIENGYVELPADTLNSIVAGIDAEGSGIDHPQIQEFPKRMSVSDFISLLVAILSVIIPMVQSCYYHKLDAVESDKQALESQVIEQQKLEIMQQQNENLAQIYSELNRCIEYLESLPILEEFDSEIPKSDCHFPVSQGNSSVSDGESDSTGSCTQSD